MDQKSLEELFEDHEKHEDLRFGALESKIGSLAKDVREIRGWVISLAVATIGLAGTLLASCNP